MGDCQQLIKFQTREFDFKGLAAEPAGVKVSFAGLEPHVRRIERAGELAKNLDVYQYHMCRLSRQLGKKSRTREEFIKLQGAAIGLLTALADTLQAFKNDPNGQRTNLDKAVRQM